MTYDSGGKLLEMKNLQIEGFSEGRWHEIVKGIDLKLKRGKVLGLIGESGAGKSTVGIASMGFCKAGCRFKPNSSVQFDSIELTTATEEKNAACEVPVLPTLRKALQPLSIQHTKSLISSASAWFNTEWAVANRLTPMPRTCIQK